MEGVSHEAASLAGHLGLGRLVYVYDNNHITIDGPTELAYTDDVVRRFRPMAGTSRTWARWPTTSTPSRRAWPAMAEADRPSLLVLRSHIGWPSPHRTDTKEAHGDPLGLDEVHLTKELLGLPADKDFYVPEEVPAFYAGRAEGAGLPTRPGSSSEVSAGTGTDSRPASAGRALPGWSELLPSFEAGTMIATRKAINKCLTATVVAIPGLFAGAGDLTGNTGVDLGGAGEIQSHGHPGGNQVHYGIREHAMVAAMTGMALHGGVLPVGGTFFVFSDYARRSGPSRVLVGGARRLLLHP